MAGMVSAEVLALIDALVSVAQLVRNSYLWRPRLPDANDDMVLETAVNGGATGLVTFNQRHFRAVTDEFGCRVLLPSEALQLLRLHPRVN